MGSDWDERLREMKCSQIVLILERDMSLSEAHKMIETLMMMDGVQAAIPNTVERERYGI